MNDIKVIISDQEEEFSPILRKAALAAIHQLDLPKNAHLTIMLAGDEELHQLNHSYMEIDAPTDVLSFPCNPASVGSEPGYLGDIAISMEQAQRQAENASHPVIQELELLVVHGVLHLCGYDHEGIDGKDQMWDAQEKILIALDNPLKPE